MRTSTATNLTYFIQWMTSAAWSFAVAVETLLSATLIIVLKRSRTGFKRYAFKPSFTRWFLFIAL